MSKLVVPVVLVKNEQYWLPYCLASVAGFFKRMVIYDIGSTDETRNIIDWYVEREKHFTDFFVRKLPHCEPEIQGIFRNSMIAEARAPMYLILDGDEVYLSDDLEKIHDCANTLWEAHMEDGRKRYGLFRRLEFDPTLTQKYDVEREHHRLYTRDAIWTGTHPGERAFYKQGDKSEVDFRSEIAVYHFHNAERSPKSDEVPSRIERKAQTSYHPGTLQPYNLLANLPILRKPIHNFAVAPALERLQHAFRKM